MTMITKAMQVVLAVAMVAGPMATAQQTAAEPATNLAGLDLRLSGLNLQTKVTVNVAYQAKDDLFVGVEKFAQGASDVTEINLDPTTMGLVGMNHGRDGEEARKMKTMVIHTYKYDKPGMYRMEDVDAYRKKLDGGNWHCAIHVRTTTGSTDICSRTNGDQTNEMVILTAEPQKLTFIHMSGKMSLDELNDMSGSATHFRPNTNLPSPPRVPREPREPKEPKVKTLPPAPPASPATPAPAASATPM